MRAVTILSALSTVGGLVMAVPTPTEPESPHKRDTLPTVTASGNGTCSTFSLLTFREWRLLLVTNEHPQ